MRLEDWILRKGEEGLAPYRARAKQVETRPEYLGYLPRMERSLGAARYWHGTGRYHYAHSAETRYGEVDRDTVADVFESIINSGGLRPYSDPWIDSGGKTVSLATVRMHARLFALIHLREREALLFELGSVRYWYRLYLVLLATWLLIDPAQFAWLIRILLKVSSFHKLQAWAGAIRRPNGKVVVSIADMLKGNALGSDIAGNYPMLFGVADRGRPLLNALPLLHTVEMRSLEPVRLGDVTHVEVPLAYVGHTEQFLATKGIALEVLPLEYVDAYLSTVPLKQLAYA